MKAAWCSGVVRTMLVSLGVATVSSCALQPSEKIETKKSVLNKMPLELLQCKTHAATLLVFPLETKSIYDTTQIAYRAGSYQVAYFIQHEWDRTPSQMLQPMLIRALENTHYFSAVLTPPYSGHYTYALRAEILELAQDFMSEPAALRLSLRLQLSDGAANQVIATKEILLREPMQEKTPDAGIVAANDATAKALQEVAKFLFDKTLSCSSTTTQKSGK